MGRGSTKQPRRSYMTCVRLSLPMPPTRRQSTADCCSSCQQALCAPRERKKSIVHCCAIVARGLANGWRAFSHRKSTYGHSLKAHDNNNHSQKGGERKPPPPLNSPPCSRPFGTASECSASATAYGARAHRLTDLVACVICTTCHARNAGRGRRHEEAAWATPMAHVARLPCHELSLSLIPSVRCEENRQLRAAPCCVRVGLPLFVLRQQQLRMAGVG